ncbi:MAG: alpha-2-macroglobulin [Chitinophagaceae bacterium]|nr:alpha-2-macroglobulin [Chitinophagaceae bacterium]
MKCLKHLLLCLLSCLLFFYAKSQTKMNTYDSAWKKIDELIQKKGLVKSAAAEVDKIYDRAKKEKNEPQFIKALLYKLSLPTGQTVTENQEVFQIKNIEKEISAAAEPAKQILQSVAAEMYWNYFRQNRWNLYDRTNTVNFNKEDIATWTIDDLHKKISELYLASLHNEKLLQQVKLETYEPILIKGNTRQLRPTLYDLLAHRALDYFENDERDVTRPAYAFTISENAAFDPVADFIHHTFLTKDSASLQYKALLIYQQLLGFHGNDKEPNALIDADLRRLEFVYRQAVMPEKGNVYKMALQHIISQYEKMPATSLAWALLAQYYYSKGNTDQEEKGTVTDSSALQSAREICDQTIRQFPKTEGAATCRNLLNSILQKSLDLVAEKINIPGEAFRTLVKYRNLSTCYFRIIKIDKSFNTESSNVYEDVYWTRLAAMPTVKQWQQQLPVANDYRSHSVEIKVDALPAGKYILLASVNQDFGLSKNLMAAQSFYASVISYVNNESDYFVLHRNTGKPLNGATIQVWTSKYDYTDRKNNLQKAELLTADKNGYFRLKSNEKQSRNIRLEITWQKDHLFMDDYTYEYRRYDAPGNIDDEEFEKQNSKIYFFTDRSIYRPGQTVYFKGIGISKSKGAKTAKVITAGTATVYLRDPNGQAVDSLTLTLNEYGSIQGQFRLPQNVLTGNFIIEANAYNYSAINFSVEEYKRPKFQVEIQAPKQGFRVNDTVSISGNAKAYAGNTIDGATVKYRITRMARFIYPWLYYRRGLPRTVGMEIANGTTTTGPDGKFSLEFAAIPDLTLDKQLDPVFDYSVQVDVTDMNGETRSATAVIPVGYKSLVLGFDLPSSPVAIDSFQTISLTSKNLSGEWQETKAQVAIYPLQEPKRLIRNRYWEMPDRFIYSEAEFIQYFPHDEYKDESDHRTWPKQAALYTDSFTTQLNFKSQISNLKFTPGWYALEATAYDKDGGEVKAIEYIQLYDAASKKIPYLSYQWQTLEAKTLQPGQTVQLLSGTAADDVFLVQQVNKEMPDHPSPLNSTGANQEFARKAFSFHTLNNEKKVFSQLVSESDRGGFGLTQFFVKHNRFYSSNNTIHVPWSNKALSVQFSTFRDKLQPGSREKWEVKISGEKGEKVAAEMLASMYDASLDQFRPHSWNIPGIWPNFYFYSNWSSGKSFMQVQSYEKNNIPVNHQTYEKNYDRLIAVGSQRYEMMMMKRMAAPSAARERNEYEDKLMSADISISTTNQEGAKDLGMVAPPPPPPPPGEEDTTTANQPVTPRKNFNETAFFFPDLKTDSAGNVSFSFTMPEALTQWKLMSFAHTKDLAMGYAQQLTVTQKELMIQPNAPRFVREKDSMAFSAKIVNMSDKVINGSAKLELINALTNETVDNLFNHAVVSKTFSVNAGQNTPVQFRISIPQQFNAPLLYRITATANNGELSDGEENALPVLTNQMLVTEALPLNMRTAGTKKFSFEKLLKSGNSATQKSYGLTVEYTANPAWYAVQSLPYLAEYPYECAEQTFNRYYANMLAGAIANSNPKIKAVFEKWSADTSGSSLQSALQKNEELKSVLLQETPWLVQANDEATQKKNIALLFDMVRMSAAIKSAFDKIKDMQTPNGGFVWFKGGDDDRYITQYILTGIGHLQKLNAITIQQQNDWQDMIDNALLYADARIKDEYDQLIRSKANLKNNNLSYFAIQYLYMRSFFPGKKVNEKAVTAYNYYRQQSKTFWLKQTKYMQGMIALSLFRGGDKVTPVAILASLKENAMLHEELGMYWKENRWGYYWHEAPIETQSLLIEAFAEITRDNKAVNDMKIWLLKQKQTQHWSNTKATAEACYALLLQGTDWLTAEPHVKINLGSVVISTDQQAEAGTGYFKKSMTAEEVLPSMGNIQVTVSPDKNTKNQSGSWGAVYWQYFEDIDKITPPEGSSMPLQLKKNLFVEKNSDRGPVLEPVTGNTKLKVGDKLKVRIELRADRNMEYVHMKDLRAAGTEPVNVLSSYKWQGGLGYYESTKDASTNFFFGYLFRGTYVFEYPLFVTHQGNFSAGVATIQCMYAPEFISHSEGVRIVVE